jgi:hypothetical protein
LTSTKGGTAVYVPARRDEMLRFFRARILGDLPRFRWGLFQETVRAKNYPHALDIAAQALDEEAERYAVRKTMFGSSHVNVAAPDRVPLYLASMFGRFDVIDRVLALERFALDEAKSPMTEQRGKRDASGTTATRPSPWKPTKVAWSRPSSTRPITNASEPS